MHERFSCSSLSRFKGINMQKQITNTHHDLLGFLQPFLESLLERLDDYPHPLRGQSESSRRFLINCWSIDLFSWTYKISYLLRWSPMVLMFRQNTRTLVDPGAPRRSIGDYLFVAWGRSSSSWVLVWMAKVWPLDAEILPLPLRDWTISLQFLTKVSESIRRCVLDTEQRPSNMIQRPPCGVVGIVAIKHFQFCKRSASAPGS